MRIRSLKLENVRCFRSLSLDFERREAGGGWTIIVGPNGTGKSTLLRAIASVWTDGESDDLRGASRAPANWMRASAPESWIHSTAEQTGWEPLRAEVRLPKRLGERAYWDLPATSLIVGLGPARIAPAPSIQPGIPRRDEREHRAHRDSLAALWGWPQVRLEQLYDWIRWEDFIRLKAERNESHRPSVIQSLGRALDHLFDGIASYQEVDTRGHILFKTDDGPVPLEDLADGLRSVFVIVAELLLRLDATYPNSADPTCEEAVCLVDELDAHLHPRLQRTVVPALRKLFPNVQFIVTTHSPYVVGGAERGEIIVLARRDGSVVAETDVPDVSGWTADQIATSSIFGLDTTRDVRGENALEVERTLLAQGEPLSRKDRDNLSRATTLLDNADGPTTALVRQFLAASSKPKRPPVKKKRSSG
jgi:energy-coupling factor transporter ATP-binding protein EcfA2